MRCKFKNCKNKAEYRLPYNKKRVFCHYHSVDIMFEKNLGFMPRIENKK